MKHLKTVRILIILSFVTSLSSQNNNTQQQKISANAVQTSVKDTQDSVVDIDGNVYKIIKIGTQMWMAENLKVTRYQNGDVITNVNNNSDWGNLTTGAYCNYDNSSTNGDIYGKLYNFYAVSDIRNIAPKGWHVPSDAEWIKLITYLGGTKVAGGKLKEKGTKHWISENAGATNESGFNGFPGGYCDGNGTFDTIGYFGNWWSSTQEVTFQNDTAWSFVLGNSFGDGPNKDIQPKVNGYSVRCIRDSQ